MKIPGVVWSDNRLITSNHFVGLCLDESAFHKILKRMRVPFNQYPSFVGSGSDASCHFLEKDNKRMAIVTLTNHKNRTGIEIAALLVHESSHIFDSICESMGEKFPSSEFKAYSLQQISQELFESYVELTK